jgi:hypothetical protein
LHPIHQGTGTQNKHSKFFNTAAPTVEGKGGPPPSNSTVAFYGGVVVNMTLSELHLADATNFNFTPLAHSPLVGAGVAMPPFTPSGKSTINAGAYDQFNGHWVPGCTFSPACSAYVLRTAGA